MVKKKEKVRGRTAAIIGMVALIAVSVPVGSCVSLARERGNASELYYGSDDEWGLLEDLAWCNTDAANLVTLAGKYLPQDLRALGKLAHLDIADVRLHGELSPRTVALCPFKQQ